jgi:hypothetical protein
VPQPKKEAAKRAWRPKSREETPKEGSNPTKAPGCNAQDNRCIAQNQGMLAIFLWRRHDGIND